MMVAVEAVRYGRVAGLMAIPQKTGVAKPSFMIVALKQQSDPLHGMDRWRGQGRQARENSV